ncbi:MAG: DUF6691 family protein [Alphaproteobacteria bacterium]|jgi:uncharacterized membrane protein YedE/YeeE
MIRVFCSFIGGSLFGLGLWISGMTDTTKVQGFLDVFGAWNPTLAFVMGGAMLPMAIAWRIVDRRKTAMLGLPFPPMPAPRFDRDLVVGSVLFGIGWALVGLCPGPALASVSFGGSGGLVFLIGMSAAIVASRYLMDPRSSQTKRT